QLMFYQGSYFVQVNVYGSLNPEPEVFIDCARSIARHIPGGFSKPPELDYLAIKGLIPGTETYYSQSALGYAFFKKGLAAKAIINGETIRIFIILGRSEKDTDEMFEGYLEYLKNAGAKMDIKSQVGMTSVSAADPLYKGLMLRKSGQYLVGTANLSEPSTGVLIIESILLRISSKK
ncbi:MAG TPA: hypothetical protein PKH70_06995, partial [Syntrophorhabdaceae bacterium]|nr:hypothetical protein [Syntrophorhabdaceae bacterium]